MQERQTSKANVQRTCRVSCNWAQMCKLIVVFKRDQYIYIFKTNITERKWKTLPSCYKRHADKREKFMYASMPKCMELKVILLVRSL